MKKFVFLIMVAVLILLGLYAYKNLTKTNTVVPDGTVDKNDLIVVETPVPGTTISSPLLVRGKARGNWYFEASFPIDVLAADGTVVGQGFATAQGEWMTEEFVPFTGSITFTAPVQEMKSGIIVFKKDNPSGLSEHDDSVSVPVQFAD